MAGRRQLKAKIAGKKSNFLNADEALNFRHYFEPFNVNLF